ncbi:MAG: PSD1 and planctomycete cytochrome C domain-containing protein [Isosphaeraceae bacterium]
MRTTLLSLSVLLTFVITNAWATDVDYVREVKPLLARHCVACHGAKKPRSGLRLDTAASALKGGKSGPLVVPGSSRESLLIDTLTGEGDHERMPLKRPPLSETEINTLRAWIDQGAHAPVDEEPSPGEPTHWAFVPPRPPVIPAVSDPAWPANPIDNFIRARLDRERITPSDDADRATLIRRVSLDLTGLPPTPSEVAAFLADRRPNAYEQLVDRLLASPQRGERWARRWLDLARYADSNGYSIDAPRSIWKYREWVIDAINRDQPFDEFMIDQIAGDLRPDASLWQKVATGFHRNTMINQEGGIDLEQFRVESIVDRVATTATVFLGLTVACAQCHDHKYDPISQKEYYELYAFFNSVDEPEIEFATTAELARRDAVLSEIKTFHKVLHEQHPEIAAREREWEKTLQLDFKQALPAELKDAFDRPIEKRTESQWRGLTELFLTQSVEYKTESAALSAIRAREPKFETSMVVQERPVPRRTYIQLGGDFTRKGDPVQPGVPAVLPPITGQREGKTSRLELARWLTAENHPLTARVTVNRVWQDFFGRGLVETENDFGTQGTPPSHPELLDWLSLEFSRRGWSLKAIQKLILMSRTYRQSSRVRPDLERVDPGNHLLARQSRLRLDAEVIRDTSLAVSGLISLKMGGPSVFPPQPEGVMTLGQMKRPWTPSQGQDRYRRGLYTFFWRATPHPGLTVFDAPNGIQACTRRNRSNSPLQALTLLNDPSFVECAEALRERIMSEGGADDRSRIESAFQTALSRSPSPSEVRALSALLASERSGHHGADPERAAWGALARVVLNLDEFITRE